MSLFKTGIEKKFLKIMAYGPGGSGKTTFGTTMPATRFWIDSEHSSDHIRDPKDPVLHTTSYKELQEAIAEIRESNTAQSLIIDPYTNFWERLIDQVESQSPKGLSFQSWAKIKKPDSRLMVDLLNLPCHIYMTLHERDEYVMTKNEETHKLEPTKIGVKPDADKKIIYRPDIVLRLDSKDGKYTATIRKVRIRKELAIKYKLYEGAVIENPTFDYFKPIMEVYASGEESAKYSDDRDNSAKDQEVLDELDKESEIAERKKYISHIERGEAKLHKMKSYGWQTEEQIMNSRIGAFGTSKLETVAIDDLKAYVQGLKNTVETAQNAPTGE